MRNTDSFPEKVEHLSQQISKGVKELREGIAAGNRRRIELAIVRLTQATHLVTIAARMAGLFRAEEIEDKLPE